MLRNAGVMIARILSIFSVMTASISGVTATEMSKKDDRTTKVFEIFDGNGDGIITIEEFQNNKILLLHVLDRNKDLVLSLEETPLRPDVFSRAARPDGKIDSLEFVNIINEAFGVSDTNHDGSLDRREFEALRQEIRRP